MSKGPLFYGDRKTISLDDANVVRFMIERLWNGNVQSLIYLRYIFHTFLRHEEVFAWMKKNNITGYKIVEYFQNESAHADGRGMLEPVRKILARVDGDKKKVIGRDDLRNPRKFD